MDAFRSGLSDIGSCRARGLLRRSSPACSATGAGVTPEVLTEAHLRSRVHGTVAPIKALMEVLCGYGPQEQRAFLRFVTGAETSRRFGRFSHG